MKHFFTFFLLFISAVTANDYVQNALIGGGKVSYGSFGESQPKLGKIDGSTSFIAGGKGTLKIDEHLYVGGIGYGIGDEDPFKRDLVLGYAVVIAGYTMFPNSLVYINVEGAYGTGEFASSQLGSAFSLNEVNVQALFFPHSPIQLEIGIGRRAINGPTVDFLGDSINFSLNFKEF